MIVKQNLWEQQLYNEEENYENFFITLNNTS